MIKKPAVMLLIFLSSLVILPARSYAIPAFARQTGFSCNTCHFQHFPLLNAFGRSFKAGGYTMVGGQSLVEGDYLSMPSVLNASLVTKLRYQKTNGKSDLTDKRNRGRLELPNEGALFLAGRVGEHIGFLLEAQLVDAGSSNWASFKLPFVYEVRGTRLGIIPFTTDVAGAAYGFELLNTGAMRMQRVIEHRSEISAQQYIGTGTEATGVAFVAWRRFGYINYTIWSPEHQSTDAKPYLNYGRLALTPSVRGWNMAIGAQVWDGQTKYTDGSGSYVKRKAEAWAFDAQAQGRVAWMPVGLYLSYGQADESESNLTNVFNSNSNDEKEAFTALVECGVIPARLTLSAAYRAGDNGAATRSKENAVTVGAVYLLTQNVQMQLNHSWYDTEVREPASGDRLLTLMVFAAF